MNDRNLRLTKTIRMIVCSAVFCGGFAACNDRFELDEPGNIPPTLGNSIYSELENPNPLNLTGTFKNFLRLIDDLGYTEVLRKTGSKTIFPANDEAFERFYNNNQWGVSKYEDLSETMKKQLLFTAMLDNAILKEMLSNVSDPSYSSGVNPGVALKHTTGVTVIDSISYVPNRDLLPQNNTYWDKFNEKDMHMVMDNTRPMIVHFTAEQLIRNNITTYGDNSDFEVITGQPYNEDENSAYIFRNRIIHSDVTCKNGYIHQLEDVLVPPGNLAELIRTNGESYYFSRMLDRFSAPFFDAATTRNYNDAALMVGSPLIDSVFQKRYFSLRSQKATLNRDPNGNIVQYLLDYDPGWNTYTSGEGDDLSDLAAIFVPTDKAMKEYFMEGEGEFLIDQYGKLPNTEENLAQNIDSIPISIVQAFLRMLMKSSFIRTVPSKFGNVMNDSNDPMGLTTDDINRNPDGTYDVKIANNGVAYMLNTVYAPNKYVAVSAPALLFDDMKVFNTAIYDGDGDIKPLDLGLNYYAYLLAMGANYAFFIPTDKAFKNFYVDPTRLKNTSQGPRALKFYPISAPPYVACSAWQYDPVNNIVLDSIGTLTAKQFKSQLIDIMNYHTIVLDEGEVMGQNHYYKTKHGGEVLFEGTQVRSGGQIDNGLEPSGFDRIYNQRNGTTYAIDHVIQPTQKSVYAVLTDSLNPQFTEFMELCSGLSADSLMEFASDRMMDYNTVTKRRRMDGYLTFIAKNGLTDNVNYFNSFNYTVWALDNEAIEKAYANGLPHWYDIAAIYDKWAEYTDGGLVKWKTLLSEEDMTLSPYEKGQLQADRDKVLAMIEEINTFIRYHFQDNSIYADNNVEANEYATASADTLGVRKKLHISGGNGILNVTDNRGNTITVNADSKDRIVNQMTRDYVFDALARVASSIQTSSFAVIHQISSPLNYHSDTDRFDTMWTGAGARQRLAAFRRLYEEKLYKRY